MAPGYEEVVCVAGVPVPGALHVNVLEVLLEVCLVSEGEGARLQLLVELGAAESVLLVDTHRVVQVVQLARVTCRTNI